MVYVNCFYYGINLNQEELKKYDFPISINNNLEADNIDFKKFNGALKIHNLTIINRYRVTKISSISELISNQEVTEVTTGDNNNSNDSENILSNNDSENILSNNDSENILSKTMKSFKSVRNLVELEKTESNKCILSDKLNYLINKTSEIVIGSINGIRQFPEIIDYYNI